ncbi:MAG TPA: hypothetical protein DDZ68_13005 [Parvularcula sp.]|nr:hypothetical protein [Parvularcula sp.]HBS30881.1 hypothetical protein [Parvularcula sp.]
MARCDVFAHPWPVARKALKMSYMDLSDDDVRQGHIGDGLLRIMLISLLGVTIALSFMLAAHTG